MAVRGAAASRRRLRRRVALIGFVVGLRRRRASWPCSAGAARATPCVTGVLVGALVAVIGAIVVALLPTSSHGPPGQH